MNIILLGKQRAGKDTSATYLKLAHGYKHYALSDGICMVARDVFGVTEKDRGLYIDIGNKMREIDNLVWCKMVERRIPEGSRTVVISDVRLQCEVDFFIGRGFVPIRIVARRKVRARRPGYNPEFESHWTECELDDLTCFEIPNEGTHDYLYDLLDKAVVHMGRSGGLVSVAR